MSPTSTARPRDLLLQQRDAVLDQINKLPLFRRGSVTEHARTCGKAHCRCQRGPEHRHEAYQWTVSRNGKTHYQTIHLGPELDKFLQETEAYQRFQELIAAYIHLTEQIADLEPVPSLTSDDALAALKKKLRTRLARHSDEKSRRSWRS
jgi:hypothetical protein